MNNLSLASSLCILVLLAVGCSGSAGESAAGSKRSPYADAGTIELEEVFTIGEESGTIFGRIVDLAVDTKGRLYAADTEYYTIRVFSPQGDSLGWIGREGEGPGEFKRLAGIALGSEDSLFAFDSRFDRISAFSDGFPKKLAYTRSIADITEEGSPTGMLKPDTTGFLVEISSTERVEPLISGTTRLAWVSPHAKILRDSIVIGSAQERGYMMTSNLPINLYLPFGCEPIFHVGTNNTIYYGWTDSVSIARFSFDGTLLDRIRLNSPSVSVTEEEVASFLGRFSGRIKDLVRTYYEEYGFSETHPPLQDFAVDGRGRLWIDIADMPHDGQSIWQIVDPKEMTIAACRLPEGVSIKAVQNGRVYAVRTAETGIQEVVIYRIREPQV